jgi:hypothetical protein
VTREMTNTHCLLPAQGGQRQVAAPLPWHSMGQN